VPTIVLTVVVMDLALPDDVSGRRHKILDMLDHDVVEHSPSINPAVGV
jgi:hypothetical protein